MHSTSAADVQAKSTNWFVAITPGCRQAIHAILGSDAAGISLQEWLCSNSAEILED